VSNMATIPREELAALRAEVKQLREILDTIWQTTTDERIKSMLATWLCEQRMV